MRKFRILPSKYFYVVLFFSMLFLSCSKLPIYKSQDINTKQPISELPGHYDADEKILFQVADNDTNLVIDAVFQGQENSMKILRGGLTLYFDPSGKKKKDYQLKIERVQNKGQAGMNMKPDVVSREDRMQNLPQIINLSYSKVSWNKNGKEFVFYRNVHNGGPIVVDLGANENNELALHVQIPLNELELNETVPFSMGITSGSVSSPNANRNRPTGMSGASRGGGGGGGRGGGMHSGSGGGRPGGSMQGGMRAGGPSSSGMSPISCWFQVEL